MESTAVFYVKSYNSSRHRNFEREAAIWIYCEVSFLMNCISANFGSLIIRNLFFYHTRKIIIVGSGLNSASGPETSEEQKKRFEIECEFVQALANPHYLNCTFLTSLVIIIYDR